METNDKKGIRRRDVIKGAIGAGGIAAGLSTASNLLFPALAQGERLIPLLMMLLKHFLGALSNPTQRIGKILEK